MSLSSSECRNVNFPSFGNSPHLLAPASAKCPIKRRNRWTIGCLSILYKQLWQQFLWAMSLLCVSLLRRRSRPALFLFSWHCSALSQPLSTDKPLRFVLIPQHLSGSGHPNCNSILSKYVLQGVFFTGPPPENLKYGKPRLGEVRCI